DGIRDATVTGVQTCALPISRFREPAPVEREEGGPDSQRAKRCSEFLPHHCDHYWPDRKPAWDKDTSPAREPARTRFSGMDSCFRSEERRVGKECRSWRLWSR